MKDKKTKIIVLKLSLLSLICATVIGVILANNVGKIDYFNVVDSKIITVSSENQTWKQTAQLNIFYDERFNESVIAPGSKGTYQFQIENQMNQDVQYQIQLGDHYDFFVNMKYRLKFENEYIIGDENTWVSLDDLPTYQNIILKNAVNTYLLEWCWMDSEHDTIAGMNAKNYTLELVVTI